MQSPLADRLRPENLQDVFGQSHLIGENKILTNIVNQKNIPNLIFYGSSGIGKTTIARIISKQTNKRLHKINGTTTSTAEIKQIFEELDTFAGYSGIVLYLDEIQYLSKKQQQTLLEYIENGKITLIASTTENPYFYIYNAILSRCTVLEFKPLSVEEIKQVVVKAFDFLEQENDLKINVSDEVVNLIANTSNGDARKAINTTEVSFLSTDYNDNIKNIDIELVKQITNKTSMRYDINGNEHYDILSAFQKSIRGSDSDAAIHYLARLVEAGDLISPCRRLLVIASEDIGLAYPNAISVVKSCVDSAMQLGYPEARILLSQATILLANAPKSNSAYLAIDSALQDIKNISCGDIPSHIKDCHYSGAKNLGRGIEYKYPHNYKNNYIKQQYLPDEIKDKKYYNYGQNKVEQVSKTYWDKLKNKK